MKILTIIGIIFQNQILMFIKAACQRSLSRKLYVIFHKKQPQIHSPAKFQKQNEMNFVAIFLLYVND
ncbi:hypothetical protein DW085_04785 [Clostridium sp. AF50-3]|nr:hypothetical protein DW085_04785 [Clostridium sp. AF50-3]